MYENIAVENMSLENSFIETVFKSGGIDIGTDMLEIGLDQLVESDVLKEVPIIGTLTKLGKIAVSVNDRRLLKSALVFVQNINNGNVSDAKVIAHKEYLDNNSDKLKQEAERLIGLLDRQIGVEKSILYANLYASYMEYDELNWTEFCFISEVIDRLFLSDLTTLIDLISKYKYTSDDNRDTISLQRLNACGLVDYFNGMQVTLNESGEAIIARINIFGLVFGKYVLKIENAVHRVTINQGQYVMI